MKMVSSDLNETISKIHSTQTALDATIKIEKNIHKFIDVTQELQKSIAKFDSSLEKSLNLTFKKIDSEVGDIVSKLGEFAKTLSEQNRVLQERLSKSKSKE
jgi:archaellum component FlaC